MKWSFSLAIAGLAAGLSAPATWAQAVTPPPPPPPPAHATGMVLQKGYTYLGIGGAEITTERARALNLKEERGVEVTSVTEDSPASRAGIKTGDVILEYNGTAVQGTEQLTRLIRETPPGRQVRMAVWRNGASQTISATVESHKGGLMIGPGSVIMPEIKIPMPEITIPKIYTGYQSPMLGIQGESLGSESQLAEFFGVKDGVLVRAVSKNSAAEKGGIKAGDIIVKVEDAHVTTSQEITRALRNLRSRTNFTITVVRAKKEMPLSVTIEGPSSRAHAYLDHNWFVPDASFEQFQDAFPDYEQFRNYFQDYKGLLDWIQAYR